MEQLWPSTALICSELYNGLTYNHRIKNIKYRNIDSGGTPKINYNHMKHILFILFAFVLLSACHKTKVGYLKTSGASFVPDTLVIRQVPDPVEDAVRIANNSPWVTPRLQGVLGTAPINYRLLDVRATDGGDAEVFRGELTVRGIGVMEVPLRFAAPKGRYIVSLEAYNEDHTSAMNEIFTFIVE